MQKEHCGTMQDWQGASCRDTEETVIKKSKEIFSGPKFFSSSRRHYGDADSSASVVVSREISLLLFFP
jgi:hypothetical protein